ncbi:MAG: BlaI/MecI/CopY family transcriptional regulator [Mariniblastus sp.]
MTRNKSNPISTPKRGGYSSSGLAKRELQIVETVVKLKEASVADVRKNLSAPPSYAAVRMAMGVLVEKKWLKFRRDGKRFLYSPVGPEKVQRNALSRVMDTFFKGSKTEWFATLLDSSASEMTNAEYERMAQLIEQAKKERGDV